MKLTKMFACGAVAAFGLLALNASAKVPDGYTKVTVNAINLIQTNDIVNTNKDITKFQVTKMKITNQDIFDLVNNEFGTDFSVKNGDQLLVDTFWDYEDGFYVADKSGTNITYVGFNNNVSDSYYLNIDWDNVAYTGTQVDNTSASISSVVDAYLEYNSADDEDSFSLDASAKVKDKYSSDSSSESFSMKDGTGSLYFYDEEVFGVLTGGLSGSGKDNAGFYEWFLD